MGRFLTGDAIETLGVAGVRQPTNEQIDAMRDHLRQTFDEVSREAIHNTDVRWELGLLPPEVPDHQARGWGSCKS